MSKNIELVKELKSKSSKRSIFFKEKIKEELKEYNIEINDTIINDIFNKALDTYTEDIKIPFLFHLKVTIKNVLFPKEDINTGIFSKLEYKVLSLYINTNNNIFLPKAEIARRVSYPMSFIEEIITKFENMDSNDIEKVFPNYEKKLKERKEYFYHLANDLKEEDIELIGYYIGGIGDKAFNIYELATKYGRSTMEIKKRLIKAFNIIKRGNNLELVLKKYKGKEKILYKKARALEIRINDIYKKQDLKKSPEYNLEREKREYKLTNNEVKILILLKETQDKLISKEKMTELSGKKHSEDLINSLIKLRNKVKEQPTLEEEILKIYPQFNKDRREYFELLSDNDIKLLSILNEKQDSISEEELTRILDFKTVQTYKRFKYNTFNKINNNNDLKLHILKFFPKIELSTICLSDKDKEILRLLEEYKDNPLSNEEMAKKLGYKNAKSYTTTKNKLLKKLRENEELLKKALVICPSLNLEKNVYRYNPSSLSSKDKKILKLLEEYKDNPLSNEEMAKRLGYKNTNSYNGTKGSLFKKIKANEELLKKALEICPSLNLEKNAYRPKHTQKNAVPFLSDKDKEILRLFEEYKDNPLSNEEMAKRLGYKNAKSYTTTKNNLLKKLRENEELLKKALVICPSLNEMPVLSDKDKEILKLLEKYKDNPLSNEEMAKKLNYNNVLSYIGTKANLFKKIKANEELLKKALEICPSLNLEKNAYRPKPIQKNTVPVLSDKDKEILELLEKRKDNPLSNNEMAKKLGYEAVYKYTYSKYNILKKIKEHPDLQKEVSTKYPYVFYEINNQKIKFTSKDITILKKYTLVKNNNLIYSSIKELANYYSKDKATIYLHIRKLKDKVISNLENNIDLNTVLWPNFIEAFIARNNFSIKESIKVNEEDLHSISDTETTKDKILLGVNKLEESIFSEYVSKRDFKDKLILAFGLGYFNKRFFTSNEVANILNTDENYVIELTKECLSKSKEAFITYNKKLSKTKK